MKRFIKISLILASVFALIGVFCMIAAFSMGMNLNQLIGMVQNGEFTIQSDDFIKDHNYSKHEDHYDLDIEFLAGKLNIMYDDVDSIEVKQEGMENFSSKIDGHTLKIRGGKKGITKGYSGYITIVIPEGYVFENVDMEIGAGQAEINDLCAESLDIEVGAGQAELINLDVQYFSATAGAGQIIAELVGNEEDYNYDVECGIGEIKIGKNSYGGFGRDTHIENPEAKREMDIECGVGQIAIEFQK